MDLKLIGDYDWNYMRNTLVMALQKCVSEEEFMKIMEALLEGIGTEEMIQKKRKELGLPKLSQKELRELHDKGGVVTK